MRSVPFKEPNLSSRIFMGVLVFQFLFVSLMLFPDFSVLFREKNVALSKIKL
jgi:hypothetical protein